jgi:hypothetical protein
MSNSVYSKFVWSPVLNLVLFNLIYHSYLKFRWSFYYFIILIGCSRKWYQTSSLKYLLTVSDIFDMHKILVIILKAPSSLAYHQVSLNCIHIFYIYTLYILTRSGREPTIYRTGCEHANHYTTDAVYIIFNMSIPGRTVVSLS